MKITTLVENTTGAAALRPEHGLSLHIETGNTRILFDMGQSDAFAQNAEALGLDLSRVDLAVLSHGHYDHGGGLEPFLRRNAYAPVYVHKLAFGPYYNGKEKYIGLNQNLRADARLIFTEGTVDLQPGMVLTDCNDRNWHCDAWGLSRKRGEDLVPDDFRHEQYLLLTEGHKRILISGCSHKGIVNLAESFKPDILIGGFHLNKQEDPVWLLEVAERLRKTGTVYYTGHCTGQAQYTLLKSVLAGQLQTISTGTVIQV